MPIKDPKINKIYQRNWWRAKQQLRHPRKARWICADCYETKEEVLTFGKDVLCQSCLRKRNTAHIKKPQHLKVFNSQKKKAKLAIRRALGLRAAAPVPDVFAYLWLGELPKAINLGLVNKRLGSKWLKEIKKIHKEFLKEK